VKKPRLLFALHACAFSTTLWAQSFQNASDCQQQSDALRAQGSQYDKAWMDCASGAVNHTVRDCRGLSDPQRSYEIASLARQRDAPWAQAKQIDVICRQMASNERNRQRQDALANAQYQRDQDREAGRQQQLSVQQAAAARQAEVMAAANQERRNELIQQQRSDAVAAQSKATQSGVLAGQLYRSLMTANETVDEETTPSRSQRTYNNIRSGAEKVHEAVQDHQPGIVNQIQSKAWEKVREANDATLGQVERLITAIWSEAMPQVTIESVSSTEINGLYEVKIKDNPLRTFSSSNGKYFLHGDMYEVGPNGFTKLSE